MRRGEGQLTLGIDGAWVGADFNFVSFRPGDTRELVLLVQPVANPILVAVEDPHHGTDDYDNIEPKRLPLASVQIHVRLTDDDGRFGDYSYVCSLIDGQLVANRL